VVVAGRLSFVEPGTIAALAFYMILTRIEDFEVFKKAQELWDAVNAILDVPGLRSDSDLRKQISDASDSMLANLDEGFEQPTDRAFANYVYRSKASTAEVRRRLHIAYDRQHITRADLQAREDLCDQVGRLATGLIAHLLRTNRKDRGISRLRKRAEKRRPTSDGQPPEDGQTTSDGQTTKD
jgi:four helix bundle protein